MLVPNQKVEVKWNNNRKWYERKGYTYTKRGDIFLCNAEDLSVGSHKKVKVLCYYCGDIVDVVWKDYVKYKDKRYSCCKCRQKKTSEKTLNKRQEHLYMSAKNFCDSKGYILLSSIDDILCSSSIVRYKCPKHGIIETKIYALLLHHGCSSCQYEEISKRSKHTIQDIIELGESLNIEILNPEEYVDYYTINLKCICNKCGKIYLVSYQLLQQNKCLICPQCSKSESRGETKVRLYLENNSINFEQQKRFYDCRTTVPLPFDFYLKDLNTVIEYDGEGHYHKVDFRGHDGTETFKRTKSNDKIKNIYCKNNNINLIRIPYWDFNNIEKILDKELFT